MSTDMGTFESALVAVKGIEKLAELNGPHIKSIMQ